MPTGYTSIVADNENLTFSEFAMRCARNFGALIMMRDEPLDAPIPEKFEPSDYYKNEYEKAKAAYENFIANPPSDEDLEKQYNEYVALETERFAAASADKDIKCRRYNAMLLKVLKWQPPTPEHEGLKEFMIDQLHDSIDFDCSEYRPLISDKEEYIARNRNGEYLKEELDFYEKKWHNEIERTNSRNKWLKELRESLKNFSMEDKE